MDFDKSILREADIRGVYPDQINGDFAYRLGLVFGEYLNTIKVQNCVVGHDNRFGGPNLTKRVIEGLLYTGIKVIYVGLLTTPMFNFACRKLEFEYGIMVTASHNPKEDNGFKLFGKNYFHCDEQELATIYKMLSDKKFNPTKSQGSLESIDITDSYAAYLAASINPGNKKMRAVVDCGNGTASIIVRKVYERLPFETIYLYCDSNPNFPNHHPDPNVKENLIKLSKAVKHNRADVGIAYDGDCDRIGIVDNKGNIIEADILMAIMCQDIIKNSDNKKILIDVKCSKTLEDTIIKADGEVFVDTPSSARQERVMNEHDIKFGGGYSNHIFLRDRHPGYDDGMYVGLRVQELLTNTDKNLNELTKDLNMYYNTGEIKIKTTDIKKFKIVEGIKNYCDNHGYKYETIDGIKAIFKDGWALVRASNTGPNLTLRFEATSEEKLKKIHDEFMTVLGILEK